MKKLNKNVIMTVVAILVVAILVGICLTRRGTTIQTTDTVFFSQFVVVEKRIDHGFGQNAIYVMYDKDSKAMYYGNPTYQGWVVPVYNEDGTVKMYTED